jgi:transcriptional regulator with XRE-family HTH domain
MIIGFKKGVKTLIETIFGKVLKSLRIKHNLSQEELAFRSDLDRTFISKLERGENQPTITTLFTLSKALNLNPSSLIKIVEQEVERENEENK